MLSILIRVYDPCLVYMAVWSAVTIGGGYFFAAEFPSGHGGHVNAGQGAEPVENTVQWYINQFASHFNIFALKIYFLAISWYIYIKKEISQILLEFEDCRKKRQWIK